MFPSLRAENPEELEFKWVKKKDVQLYESFTYDGLDYSLYDCVYLSVKGEPQPYIGKLIGIWENADKSKQINIQWFFRPSEIVHYLGDAEVQKNELFLASGHGVGLATINPLEALGGKCNVVCISTDRRNPQPSPKELMMADYVFYRIFDVKKLEISDQIGDIVGGLEVEYVFNRKDNKKTPITQNLDPNSKYDVKNVTESEETQKLAGEKTLEQLYTPGLDENYDHRIESQFTDPKQQYQAGKASLLGETDGVSSMKKLTPGGKYSLGVDVQSIEDKAMSTIDKEGTESAKSVGCNFNDEKETGKAINSPTEQIRVKKTGTSVRVSNELEDTPSKRSKLNGICSSSQDTSGNKTQSSPLPGNDTTPLVTSALTSSAQPQSKLVKSKNLGPAVDVKLANAQPKSLVICALSANAQPKSKLVKGQKLGPAVDVKLDKKSSSSNEKLSNTSVSLSKGNLKFGCAGNGIENEADSNRTLKTLGEGLHAEISDLGNAKNIGTGKDFGGSENSSPCRERSSAGNVFSPNEPSSSRCKKDFDGPGQATKLAKDQSSLTRKVLKKNAHSREAPNLEHNNSNEKDDETLLKDLCLVEERPPKKAKYEDPKTSSHDDKVNGKKLEGAGASKAKNSLIMNYDKGDVQLTKDSCLAEETTHKTAKCEDSKILRCDDNVDGKKFEEIGASKAKNPLIMSRNKNNLRLTKDRLVDERSQKKTKCNNSSISRHDDKVNGKKMEEIGASKTKNSFITSDDSVKSNPLKKTKRLDEGPSKECCDKTCKVVDRSLSKLRVPMSSKVEGKTFEVTRRPPEKKCKWLGELPWEENMKSAYGERRVVLLQNLDPKYTSGDVEDIIWHAFQEYGTARIMQQTAILTPNSGQAFFIFKNRKAVKDIVKKLDTGCLMLPNNRPLVVSTEFDTQLPGSSQKKFVGHLFIDKVRRQEQVKEAICTSHYAQDNTLEYDMAMEWILLYYNSDEWWKRLHQQQKKEIRKLVAHLKSK